RRLMSVPSLAFESPRKTGYVGIEALDAIQMIAAQTGRYKRCHDNSVDFVLERTRGSRAGAVRALKFHGPFTRVHDMAVHCFHCRMNIPRQKRIDHSQMIPERAGQHRGGERDPVALDEPDANGIDVVSLN